MIFEMRRIPTLLALLFTIGVGVYALPAGAMFEEQDSAVSTEVAVNLRDGLSYIRVSPGTFRMGCSANQARCSADEQPAHPVTLTKVFWLGRTEVTVQAYKRFVEATGRKMPPEPTYARSVTVRTNPNWEEDNQPITNVTWDEASAYCKWAEGRLPTEAEWEYAARAGDSGGRYGSPDEIAWYSDNSGVSRVDSVAIRAKGEQIVPYMALNGNRSHPVGQKAPNPLGFFDMLGNVWEWVADFWGPYSESAQTDPTGAPTGNERTQRGSGFLSMAVNLRYSFRVNDRLGGHDAGIGIRCALDKVPK